MKRSDLKKLALMGITGGMMLAQSSAQADVNAGYTLAGGSCGNSTYAPSYSSCNSSSGQGIPNQGCSSTGPRYTADRDYPVSQGCASRSDSGQFSNQNPYQGSQYRQYNPDQNPQPMQQSTQQPGYPSQQNQPQDNSAPRLQSARSNPVNYFIADENATSKSYQQGSQQGGQQGAGTQVAGKTITEEELKRQLNEAGRAMFNSLSPEGKALALKLASQSCKGQNDCKGLASCATSDHSCAGKNSCAGTTKGPFTDKNTAVKVAAQKMAEKRASMNKY